MNLTKVASSLLLIATSLIVVSCANSTESAAHLSLAQYVQANCPYEDVVHPILCVKAKDGLNGRVLDKQIFIELLNYNPQNGNVIWKRDFYKAEKEAAAQCCATVIGMQKDKLSYVLGQPAYISNHQNLLQIPVNEEIWMYKFGGNKIPIELRLKNNVCTSARNYDWTVTVKQNRIPPVFWEPPVQYHPILKVRPNQDIADQDIHPSLFRKLKNSSVVGPHSNWEQSYRKAEKTVAGRFCEMVLGMSENDITSLVGQPRFKIPGLNYFEPGDSIWLYWFGGTDVSVRLIMHNNKCRLAELYGYEDELKYITWRQEEIRNFAIGKTMEQIVAKEGSPLAFNTDNLDSRDLKPTANSEEQYPMVYFVSPSMEISLFFKDGHCVSSSEGGISH